MTLVKVLKTPAYFSRFQPKFRRRREGKTDYKARRALVRQAKDKYASQKLRLVVRKTNKKIICQVVSCHLIGDKILETATSDELPRYGITFGLTNYAAAYATGLLLARRLLHKMDFGDIFKGTEIINGEEFTQSESPEGKRPMRCILDVGISRTTTGNRVFAAMKGAVDGGLNIPHNVKRFVGYDSENKTYNAELMREHIFGQHVAKYMADLKEADQEAYQRQFSSYIKQGIQPENMEELYMEAHKKIRASPMRIVKDRVKPTWKRVGHTIVTPARTYVRRLKLTKKQRKSRVEEKLRILAEGN